jgi:hypothetical protein
MCGNITGSVLENNFQVDPEAGLIWHNPEKDCRGQKRAQAGYIKPGSASTGGGYRLLNIRIAGKLKKLRAHHVIWCWVHGEWPSGEIDHINGDRDDNRIANLRLATVAQNRTNKTISSNNTSGYKWVSWHKASKQWRAEVWHRGKRYFSYHPTAEVAYEHACDVASKLHGSFYNSGFK